MKTFKVVFLAILLIATLISIPAIMITFGYDNANVMAGRPQSGVGEY